MCTTVLVFSSDPPLLLISLDGFLNSYFQRNVTPALKMLCELPFETHKEMHFLAFFLFFLVSESCFSVQMTMG